MDRLSQEQIRRNIAADNTWTSYASHRTQVNSILKNACGHPSDRIMLLGAGNLNDVELSALLESFAKVTLVDLDSDAVLRGVARQGITGDPRIQIRTPIDLTGAFEDLSYILKFVVDTKVRHAHHCPTGDLRGNTQAPRCRQLVEPLVESCERGALEKRGRCACRILGNRPG